MHTAHASIPFTLALFHALFAATVALPKRLSLNDGNLLILPNPSIFASPSPANQSSFPLTVRRISILCRGFSRLIPQAEVEETFEAVDSAIDNYAQDHPDERLHYDRFEFIRPDGGRMLISISANAGETITYNELLRILESLHSYMTGNSGKETTHYQELNIIIRADEVRVGLGVIRHISPAVQDTQQRTRNLTTAQIATEDDLSSNNQTLLHTLNTALLEVPAANATHLLSSSSTTLQDTVFRVPGTDIEFTFTYPGTVIPSGEIKSALANAQSTIKTAVAKRPDHLVPEEKLTYKSPSGHVVVTILFYRNKHVSYSELDSIITGLDQFCSQAHNHVLVFEVDIRKPDMGRMAFGTLLYDAPRNSAETTPTTSITNGTTAQQQLLLLRLPNVTAPSVPNQDINWPIAGTPITLTFTYTGGAIPAAELDAVFAAARTQNAGSKFRHQPLQPIEVKRFEFVSPNENVVVNIVLYGDRYLTWWEVTTVLKGLENYCEQGNRRVLVFEIDIAGEADIGDGEKGRVAFATLLYNAPARPPAVPPGREDVLARRMDG